MQTLVSGVMLGCLYAFVALGFAMILGISHSLNLAHGEIVTLGGYIGYGLWAGSGLHPLLLIPVAAAALLPLAFLWHWMLDRLPAPRALPSLALTFGWALLLQALMRVLWPGPHRLISSPSLAASTRLGWVTLNHGRAVVLAMALSGGAGVLLATTHYVYPTAGVELTLLAIVLTIWAGVGRLLTVLLAGLLLGIAESLTVAISGPAWREPVIACLLLASLLARPPVD